MMDFATRAYNHSYRLDPIIRSLLDTDFYKISMAQFIWERHPNVRVEWSVTNRTKSIRIADEIDINELRAQLDHVRTLRFAPSELIWLRGQTFYGQTGIFTAGFIDALRILQLPEYHLDYETDDNYTHGFAANKTGQFILTFAGSWFETTLWEIYALAIINELRTRAVVSKLSRSTLDITYARAKVALYEKLERLSALDGLNLTDFGTRRRHSFLWQEHCVMTAAEVLGDKFTGTSNVYLAMKHGFEAKGSNAHELPMVFAALGQNDEAVKQSQYDVLKEWQNMYNGNMLVFLPDTFGTTQFLNDAPQWLSNWTGARPDSKNPYDAAEELIGFWKKSGLTPEQVKQKLILFSDGLNADMIWALHTVFSKEVRVGFGWGTNFTNAFANCVPGQPDALKAISLVCKVKSANGRGCVKLSDNYEKVTAGDPNEVERYRNIFGTAGMENIPVLV